MDIITKMAHELQDLKYRVTNMLRPVNVAEIHPAEALVDVAIDAELVIERIPFLTRRAGDDKTYWMPSVGEEGYLLSPSGELDNAAFLPAIFSDKIAAPRDHEKWTTREWADGTTETYDKEAHEYILKLNDDTHRKVNRAELQDKRGKTELNMDGTTAKLERTDKGHFKADDSETEITFPTNAKIELNDSEIKLTFGTNSIKITATKVEMRTPTGWIVLTAALANVCGATFAAGATNMFNAAGTVVYTSVPA